ncbi:MAG: hypothetical protein ACPGR7_09830 [Flavobacteriaceae bacterium]
MKNLHNNPFTDSLTAYKRISAEPFEASASFGLKRHYSQDYISFEEFIDRLQYTQRIVKQNYDLDLSVQVTQTQIVLHKHQEPHVRLDFINYPQFPTEIKYLKNIITYFVEFLATQLMQNRVVINFPDEHLMISKSDQLDPGVTEVKEIPQELQAAELFSKYQGSKLLSSTLSSEGFLVKRFPDLIETVNEEAYLHPQGIPLFQRSIQAGKARPIIPALELFYDKPTRIAIYTKFLLSGTPINLEIWEVQGQVDLNSEKPGRLIQKIKAND